MPTDQAPQGRHRRVRLVPVSNGVDRPEAIPVAKETLAAAMCTVGPSGIGSVEARLAAVKEVEDTVSRGGKSEVRGGENGSLYSVRICNTLCEFRVGGGPGCDIFQKERKKRHDLNGEQCALDMVHLQTVEKAFREGDESTIRGIAGRMTGAVFIEIRKLLDAIIADGACVEEPIFDAKGAPIIREEIAKDETGKILKGAGGIPIILKIPLTRKREHPLYPRLTTLLKETRIIDTSQFLLTPKSSGMPGKTDGMVLMEETEGDRKRTLLSIQGEYAERLDAMRKAVEKAALMRQQDSTWKKMNGTERPELQES